jgi:asparagine synthase (glutamine-hydrolysing)
MCGIVALTGKDSTTSGVVEKGVQALLHRGPDGNATWHDPGGLAALGHARLAIVDLSPSGAQPMRSRSGKSVITFNGEIFNYRELRARVRGPLRSRSDTEVLLELFEQEGALALSWVRGMFAFAVWDGRELFVARDRIGIKPLFYVETPGSLAVASEIGALLAMGRAERRADPRAIDDYLTYFYVPPPRTAIAGCLELPPGHILRWTAESGSRMTRYWEPPTELSTYSVEGAQIHDAIEDSVRTHLVADTPVGVFLSGGLDSSALVAMASKHYPGRLKTLCVGFGNESHFDERVFARDVANRYDTDHTEIEVRADVRAIVPELPRHFGQPFGAPPAVLGYALSKAAAQEVKVALAGDGGDELLGGYPRYSGLQVAALTQRMPTGVREALASMMLRLLPAGAERGLAAHRWRRFAESVPAPRSSDYFRWVAYADSQAKAELLVDRAAFLANETPPGEYEFLEQLRERYGDLAMPDAAPRIDLESFLPYNVLAQSDRTSMAHGLEVRVPFCDHKLVEAITPLALRKKLPFGVPKGILRWALARDLPARVLTHKKVGFLPPVAAWLRTDLHEYVHDILSPASVRARGILRPSTVARLLKELDAGRSDHALTVWSLMMLEGWFRWLEKTA